MPKSVAAATYASCAVAIASRFRIGFHRQSRVGRPFAERGVVELYIEMAQQDERERIGARGNAATAIGDDPFRGRPNSPYLLAQTLLTLASVMGLSTAELCQAMARTVYTFFGLDLT